MAPFSRTFDAKRYWANKPLCTICKKHKVKNGTICYECEKSEAKKRNTKMKKDGVLQIDKMEAPTIIGDFPVYTAKKEENKPVSQKAKDVFHKYKEQAIDFSRRNRLLKYPAKATKIEFNLTLEECEGYFGEIQELSVNFPHRKILESENKQGKLLKEDAEPLFDPRTTIIGKKLISLLDKLRLQSKKNFEEHGLHTLFLVIGEIGWKEQTVGRGSTEATKKVQDYKAPLLLIPIELENSKEPYKATNLRLNIDQQPIRVNPVLLSFIKQNLDLRALNLPEDLSDVPYTQIRKIFSDLADVFKDKGIAIETFENVYVGQFSFHGQQIHEDLEKNEGSMIQHPFVSGVCSGDTFEQNTNDRVEIDEDYNSDDFLNKEEDFTIVDADSSQIVAIKKIVSGENMVIHGPPGTGKSQTIANIISNLLARNKTVLFVCEKQVALDVVYKRLSSENEASVADLCLPLFRYVSNKKQFASDIINSRASVIRESKKNKNNDLGEVINERQKKVEFLKEYAEEVVKKVEPLDKNLYWIFGQLGSVSEKSKEVSVSWKDSKSPTGLSVKDFFNQKQILKDLNPFILLLNETDNHWNGLKRKHFSPDFTARLHDALKECSKHIKANPYSKENIEYFSWIKTLSFFEKVTNNNFLSLTEKDLLKVDYIQTEKLTELSQKVLSIKDLSSKYQTLNENNRFSFVENWEIQKELKPLFLNDQKSLEILYSNIFNTTVSWLSESTKKLSSPVSTNVDDLTVKDFEAKSFLFSIDHNLVPVVLRPKTDLYDLSNQVKVFQNVYTQLQQTQEILNKYGINSEGLSEERVLSLEDIFTKRYKTFFRFFSTAYKSDKENIISWCGFLKPTSYKDIKIICFAVATKLRLQKRLNDDWDKLQQKFNLNYEVRKLPLQYINEKLDTLVHYLESNSLEFVEPYIQEVITNEESNALLNTKAQIIKKFINEYEKISSGLILNIFDQKVSDLERIFINLIDEVTSIKVLSETVSKFVEYHKDISINEVLKDNLNLNNLRLIFNNAQELTPHIYLNSSIQIILTSSSLLSEALVFINSLIDISSDLPKIKYNDFQKVVFSINKSRDSFIEWNKGLENIVTEIGVLFENDNLSDIYFSHTLDDLNSLLLSLIQDKVGLEQWIEYQKYRYLANESGLGWFIEEVGKKVKVDGYQIDEIYTWVFFNKWLEDYCKDKPILRDFNKQKYEKIIDKFKSLERESFEINRQRILRQFLVPLESSKNYGGEAEKVLSREAEKKRQHLPIRTLVRKYAHHLQQIKPCWMVSPLALSSYLEYGTVNFDVVIFDEASQMRIENALGAISRAKQIVVIGDEHQLPPTPFFGFSLEDEEGDDDEIAEETGFESILQRAISLLNGSEEYLKYHYRSASEDLIAFSNHHIYKAFGSQLITFPNANKRPDQGVHFEFVKDGFFDGGKDGTKSNPKEAERVADLCITHAEENNGSLGVIAFSKSQEKAIRSVLEEKLKSYPHLAEKLDETSTERDSFFIKNLESVQGDERDRIILSVCYGPDKVSGKVRNHFGPINQNSGYRRLNVAITRAKEQLICVSSMHAYDMHPPEGTFGAKLLQQYLEYAEKGSVVLEASKIVEDIEVEADSDFELSVEAELKMRGYTIRRQVGASGFKIDLAVVSPKNNNEYILGIECDGATYHSTKSARIRDRIRQDVLEKLGWKIYRIWSQHWFSNKDKIIEDIIETINRPK
jgi:superfamily I DNA and/or RNA helicase/very-short-patch-repair endonuclease